MDALSDYIAKRRRTLRLTQEEVVERMRQYGVERAAPTLANWETGRQPIPVEALPALAAALEEKTPVRFYELAGILSYLPGAEIVKLLDGLPPEDIRRFARMIEAFLEEQK